MKVFPVEKSFKSEFAPLNLSSFLGATTTSGLRKGLNIYLRKTWKYWAAVVQLTTCMLVSS